MDTAITSWIPLPHIRLARNSLARQETPPAIALRRVATVDNVGAGAEQRT
jgi:hypothetical protein